MTSRVSPRPVTLRRRPNRAPLLRAVSGQLGVAAAAATNQRPRRRPRRPISVLRHAPRAPPGPPTRRPRRLLRPGRCPLSPPYRLPPAQAVLAVTELCRNIRWLLGWGQMCCPGFYVFSSSCTLYIPGRHSSSAISIHTSWRRCWESSQSKPSLTTGVYRHALG